MRPKTKYLNNFLHFASKCLFSRTPSHFCYVVLGNLKTLEARKFRWYFLNWSNSKYYCKQDNILRKKIDSSYVIFSLVFASPLYQFPELKSLHYNGTLLVSISEWTGISSQVYNWKKMKELHYQQKGKI